VKDKGPEAFPGTCEQKAGPKDDIQTPRRRHMPLCTSQIEGAKRHGRTVTDTEYQHVSWGIQTQMSVATLEHGTLIHITRERRKP
jgi:hypothetical protein